jgi:hypothetical protein
MSNLRLGHIPKVPPFEEVDMMWIIFSLALALFVILIIDQVLRDIRLPERKAAYHTTHLDQAQPSMGGCVRDAIEADLQTMVG